MHNQVGVAVTEGIVAVIIVVVGTFVVLGYSAAAVVVYFGSYLLFL